MDTNYVLCVILYCYNHTCFVVYEMLTLEQLYETLYKFKLL